MSASPSIPTSGVTPTNTTGAPPRKRPPVNIFAQKKKPVRKPAPAQTATASRPTPNGAPVHPAKQTANGPSEAAPKEGIDYAEFPIYVSKDSLMQGLHYHAMKLQTRADKDGKPVTVSPYDTAQFTRPLRLHRRNARDKMETAEMSDAASGVDDKEREMMNIKRAEREAEKEANRALIAPTGGDSKKAVKKKPQKKVEDVYFNENDPRQKQRSQLRYEEARPWHLEDFEGKNVWVGSYEEPLSDTCVMFEIGESGFRMIPIEKWYRFTQTNRFKVMDSDEVEKHMSKKVKAPRWFLGTQAANDEERRQEAARQHQAQRAQNRRFEDDDNPYIKQEDYQADRDEIDFEWDDEFQDDDEGFIFGEQEDEDTKEIEKKIRDEQRTANLAGTGVKDEDRDWDEEEQQEKRAEKEERRRTKRLRKQLQRKERKNEYDSDSSHGEFSESSDTEDTEEERERLEEERKQEEAKKLNGDKSGASTKGTNTPTNRGEKRDHSKLGASLKRPGSPDLSELSGNESSRKKVKSVNGRAVSTSAPNGARSLSPDAAKLPRTGTGGSGSGSDTDTSRTGRPKIRLKNSNSPTGTPSASGSRAQSPARKAAAPTSFPTLEEVKAAIPPGGVGIKDLADLFKPRVLNRQSDFILLVKQAGKQDTATKKIMPKPPQAGGEAMQ